MLECYTMQILETKKTKNKKKSNGHKEWSNEAQGPCQKDSLRLSLLHPKLFRCTSRIGFLIHIRMISNSRIGIKVKILYQFNNKYHRILCLWHRHFWFVFSLSSLQLETVWTYVPRFSTKMTNSCRLIMQLTLKRVKSLRFRLLKINPNLPKRCNFIDLVSLTEGLTTLLIGGSEEEEGTKFMEWGADTEMLSTKPKLVLSDGDF